MNKDVVKKTLYFSKRNDKNLRKASYLANLSQSVVINKLIEKVLEDYVKELEKEEE